MNRSRVFLAAYRKCGHIGQAAKAADIRPGMHYRRLKRDPEYRKAFEEAHEHAIGLLVDEAVRRAIQGTRKGVYYKGRRVGYQLEYSDGILIRLLEARLPREFRRNAEITGPNGGPIEGRLEVVFITPPKDDESS